MAKEGRILVYFDELVMSLAKVYGATMDANIYSPRDILSSIQGLHRVDAEEVVRCKDCTEGMFAKNSKGNLFKYGSCNKYDLCVKTDHFCSYGERREGE